MTKLDQKIQNRINMLKTAGKKMGKDYFLNDQGNLIIKKKGYNEIVRAV